MKPTNTFMYFTMTVYFAKTVYFIFQDRIFTRWLKIHVRKKLFNFRTLYCGKIGLLKFQEWWSHKLRIYLRHACIYSELGLNQKRMNFVSVHNLFLIWFWILAFITFSEPAVRTWSLFDQLSKSKLTFSSAIKPSTVNLELFFYSEAQGLALISTV